MNHRGSSGPSLRQVLMVTIFLLVVMGFYSFGPFFSETAATPPARHEEKGGIQAEVLDILNAKADAKADAKAAAHKEDNLLDTKQAAAKGDKMISLVDDADTQVLAATQPTYHHAVLYSCSG
eukprot:TRINITY_DN168_c0_g1_i1.p1 TRINITY_DN168_c0_g1~~TRINITY_DN168_c0_g1_i1.p1  ORF type:complete len:122 (+),score=13.73 TRINITY_DN168_c0_g1_i1:57-422(+)